MFCLFFKYFFTNFWPRFNYFSSYAFWDIKCGSWEIHDAMYDSCDDIGNSLLLAELSISYLSESRVYFSSALGTGSISP